MANSIHKSLGKINYKIENMIIDYTNADLYTFSKNNGVTFVEEQRAFIVNGNNNFKKKYAVTLFPKQTCQCPATGTCYHILAARLEMGDTISDSKKVVNLKQLSKNNLKRNDKKSGRKMIMIRKLYPRPILPLF